MIQGHVRVNPCGSPSVSFFPILFTLLSKPFETLQRFGRGGKHRVGMYVSET